MKLWEVEHPYHCEEGEPGKDRNTRFESWSDFLDSSWATHDPDLVLLFRWDWYAHEEGTPPEDPEYLLFHFFLQHKGWHHTCHIKVRREEEPSIRTYLAAQWALIRRFWIPISSSY